MIHPESPEGIKELEKFVMSSEVMLVHCEGCGCDRMMNSAYGRYVNKIKECRFCREDSSDISQGR